MAGLDDGYSGEARLTAGFTVGYLAQEPQLDPAKDVKGNVMDGVAEVQSIIDQYNEVMAKWADPDADYDKIGKEQARLEDKIAATDAWSLERNVEIAMDALALPARRRRRHRAVRWRASPCRAVPPPAVAPRPAAARRADQPPRRRIGRLAGEVPRRLRRHGRRHHPRPLLPRQRRQVDPRTRSRQGLPLRGQLLELARAEAGTPRTRGARQRSHASARSPANSNGCGWRRRPARRRARPDSPPTRSSTTRRRRPRPRRRRWRSRSRPAVASATR